VAPRVVPARPDLGQYKKQAKDLLKGIAEAAPQSLERLRLHHPRLRTQTGGEFGGSAIKLADAQLVIAREHGFESWPKFAGHLAALHGAPPGAFEQRIRVGDADLTIEVAARRDAKALVLFILAGNVSRYHPAVREIAAALNRASCCTVLADLLTEDEDVEDAVHESLRYDVRMLGDRATGIADFLCHDARFEPLRLGLFCSGTGAAAGVITASERPEKIRALVCSAGRADLAGPWLVRGGTPTLFIVGGDDAVGLGFTRFIATVLPPQIRRRVEVIDGAGDRFDSGPASEHAASLAAAWFSQYLMSGTGDREGNV
jgi:putative phosphoribosyl transferase